MNKTTLIMFLLALSAFTLTGQNDDDQGDNGQAEYFRGFEGSAIDNWDYTSNIPFYAENSDTDLWTDYSQGNGRISGAFSGGSYLAGRDLDNPTTEALTGEASPEHILTFAPFATSKLGAEFTFRLHYFFLDKNDYIYYELSYDNGTSWSSPDEHIDVFATTQGGKFSLTDWAEIKFDVPSGHDYVRMRLVIYQNGNGYIGLDNFEMKTVTLSTSSNLIDGFSFGPNPTQGILRLKANAILDKAMVYDVLGKEILTQKGNSTEMLLDISHLAKGVYFTKVESNGITQTVRVIKK